MPTISYAITAHNEHEELKRLLDQIVSNKQHEDEIVVQVDEAKVTDDVMAVLLAYSPEIASVVKFPLNKDFASFKNNLKRHCKKDYIFFVDADEYFSANLIYNLPKVVEQNPEADLFGVPRVNTVEGITEDHIKIWNWVVDEKGRVNWPDYQTRLVRNSPNRMGKQGTREDTGIHSLLRVSQYGRRLVPIPPKNNRKTNQTK